MRSILANHILCRISHEELEAKGRIQALSASVTHVAAALSSAPGMMGGWAASDRPVPARGPLVGPGSSGAGDFTRGRIGGAVTANNHVLLRPGIIAGLAILANAFVIVTVPK